MQDRQRWPNQVFARQETHRLIEEGCRSFCITSPTGSGKSVIMADDLTDFVQQGHQCAVFTNRKLLTSQLSRGLNASGIHVGVRAADFESWTDPNAPVQICGVQTEIARVLNKRQRAEERAMAKAVAKEQFRLFPATRVLVDECHMNKGARMEAILREYEEEYGAIRIGITATPIGVSKLYEKLVIAGTVTQMRQCGALVPAYCYEPASFDIWKIRRKKTGEHRKKGDDGDIDYDDKVTAAYSEWNQTALEDRVKSMWSQCVVGHIFDHWKKLNPDARPSLGMAPGVKESLGLAVEFHQRGVNAAHIDGEGLFVDGEYHATTEQEARDEVFARSKSGEVPIIWNRFTLREAIDLPWLEFLSIATPIASLSSYVQVVGRVLRASTSTGKTHATIIDHAGVVRVHGSPNMDRDQDWLLYYEEDADKITKDRIEKMRSCSNSEPEPITCPECGMIRKSGPKCLNPKCGFEHSKSIRKIIQEDGQLKKTEADFMPKRREKSKPNTVTLWTQVYYRCKNAKKPMTFSQARALFFREHHYWPPKDLPYMPAREGDWGRKIGLVPWENIIHPVKDPNKGGTVVDPQQKMDFE